MTRCSHCHRPEGIYAPTKPALDGTGEKCWASTFGVRSNDADVERDCELAKQKGTAEVYAEGERRKREHVKQKMSPRAEMASRFGY